MSSPLTDPTVLSSLQSAAEGVADHRHRGLHDRVTALFDQFRDALLRYLWSLGLALPDGEEVLQEVFLSLFQHLRRGRRLHNPRAWLFRVAHNQGLKRRLRQRRDADARVETDLGNLAVDLDPSPEDRIVNGQTRERLMSVVGALPEQDRRCLFLRAEGLRYREIASVLDISLGAVSLSLARSLARIARSKESGGL